ncbi:HupE/UreJ family protein [Candidatus Pelagibacter sp.]|nr:HupE/UreJ family protein [Candidatus Pelagibacter sp.]MDA9956077.1 HupE/UreJ family protein [Candidatus Pelagibacter sp.]
MITKKHKICLDKLIFFKIFIFILFFIKSSYAHELRPAIANLNIYEKDNIINANLSIQLNLEAIITGIETRHSNTEESEKSEEYQDLRRMNPAILLNQFNSKIKNFGNKINITSSISNLDLELISVVIPEVGNTDIIRDTIVTFDIQNIKEERFKFSWDKNLGSIILRINSTYNKPLYTELIEDGKKSKSFSIKNQTKMGLFQNIREYTLLGFKHIIPKGLDHILFVLALFLLSPKMKPLVLQVSIFTLAHTITLFLGALKIITIPAIIIEPIIALSICFIAIENLFIENIKRTRPYIIFIFGLLHGLGFAGVLNEIGISTNLFISSLISFNLGVELGQISVIILSYILIALFFQKKLWYRNRVTKPISIIIASVGFYWFIQRLFF